MRIGFRNMMEACKPCFHLAAMVANGAEALAHIEANPVDIVVTDLKMPVMDGLELISRLRAGGFPGRILVLSNYNDFDLVRTALTRGASDYVLKQTMDAGKLLQQLEALAESITDGGQSAGATRAEGAPKDLQALYESGGAYLPCLLRVRRAEAGGRPAMNRVLVVLEQVLGDSAVLMAAMDEDKELLFLAHGTDGERVRNKLAQVVRSLHTYLNLNADALIGPPASSPEQARQYYAECAKLMDTAPALSEPPVRTMEEALFAHMPQFSKLKREVCGALLFIHFHFAEKITLDDIARSVNLNPSYLCRLFKQETGEAMFRHINDLRMREAARLIEAGYTYMRGVAADVGIDDQFYFTRVFKKYHGVAPSEYGKARRQET